MTPLLFPGLDDMIDKGDVDTPLLNMLMDKPWNLDRRKAKNIIKGWKKKLHESVDPIVELIEARAYLRRKDRVYQDYARFLNTWLLGEYSAHRKARNAEARKVKEKYLPATTYSPPTKPREELTDAQKEAFKQDRLGEAIQGARNGSEFHLLRLKKYAESDEGAKKALNEIEG